MSETLDTKKYLGQEGTKALIDSIKSGYSPIDHVHETVTKAEEATHSSTADTATEATHAISADTATNADYATNAGHSTTADESTKAIQDGNGNVLTETYETKEDALSKLSEAKEYADNLVKENDNDLEVAYVNNRITELYQGKDYEVIKGKVSDLVTYIREQENASGYKKAYFYFNIDEYLDNLTSFDYYFFQLKGVYNNEEFISHTRTRIGIGNSAYTPIVNSLTSNTVNLDVLFYADKIYNESYSLVDMPEKCAVRICNVAALNVEDAEIFKECINNAEFSIYASRKNVLTLNNTIEFVPTGDYNPATKKYVDDTVASLTDGSFVISNAEHAATADSATKAEQDGDGNVIVDTYETKTDAEAKLEEAKGYADTAAATVKDELLNGAGEAYDTLKELGDLINENTTALDALEEVATGKADKSHTHVWNDLLDQPFGETFGTETMYSTSGFPSSVSINVGTLQDSTTKSDVGNYTITFNGTDYNFSIDANTTSIGTNENFPFTLTKTRTGQTSYQWLFKVTGSTSNNSLKVVKNTSLIKPLSSKFIPNEIARVTDLVGKKTSENYGEIFNDYQNNISSGKYSHAEGYKTEATGDYSHAEGNDATASGEAAHAEGIYSESSGSFSHAEGFETTASHIASHAEGHQTTASGQASHAEGSKTTASGTVAHAEGYETIAFGEAAHAEGYKTQATGNYSHSEGYETEATGEYTHTEGIGTVASGAYAHAEGANTIAAGNQQHVQGKSNIEDTENKYAHIVGNGASGNSRSNAHTVDWHGNAWYSGDVYVGSTSGVNKDEGSKKLATEEYVDIKISEIPDIPEDVLVYTEQELTEEQQMQARKNLGLYYTGTTYKYIIPEQEVTFDGRGYADVVGFEKPFDGMNQMDVTLVVGDYTETGIYNQLPQYDVYEYDGDASYLFENGRLIARSGTPYAEGGTATIKMYFIEDGTATIPEEYLPNTTNVKYTEQELTDEQKNQARKNIGLYHTFEQSKIIYNDCVNGNQTYESFVEDIELDDVNFIKVSIYDDYNGDLLYEDTLPHDGENVHMTGYCYYFGNGGLIRESGGVAYLEVVDNGKPIVISNTEGILDGWCLYIKESYLPRESVVNAYRVEITCLDEVETVYDTIPEEYIPDTIARTDNILNQANSNSADYIYSPSVDTDLATKAYVDTIGNSIIPTQEEAIALVTELGFVEPISNNGFLLTEDDDTVFVI